MKKKNILKRKGGFTLIELIVVIAILGILAALVIPRLGIFTEKATLASEEATAATIAHAAQAYVASDGNGKLDDTVLASFKTDIDKWVDGVDSSKTLVIKVIDNTVHVLYGAGKYPTDSSITAPADPD